MDRSKLQRSLQGLCVLYLSKRCRVKNSILMAMSILTKVNADGIAMGSITFFGK